ncbi:hypothetical protein BJX76DRAFT_188238 [Aspergillus varians]
MVDQVSSLELDPTHTSCLGGRTVVTCRSCAGNAPRTAVCSSCKGQGFNTFVCAHCHPAVSVNRRTSAATSTVSTPASLSRSSSNSAPPASCNEPVAPNSLRRVGDQNNGSGDGRVDNNSSRRS